MDKIFKKNLFCLGILGNGMLPFAIIYKHKFCGTVAGSDRGYSDPFYNRRIPLLSDFGIRVYPQDCSGIETFLSKFSFDTSNFIVSNAVEDRVNEVKYLNSKNIKLKKMQRLLAELTRYEKTVAVSGTSGKSTVTGMISWVLKTAFRTPCMYNGASLLNTSLPVMLGDFINVFEADESSGNIRYFYPEVGLIHNITEDHFSIEELRKYFEIFAKNSKKLVINVDCPVTSNIKSGNVCATFGKTGDYKLLSKTIQTDIEGTSFKLKDPAYGTFTIRTQLAGYHNVINAMGAYAVLRILDLKPEVIIPGLASFKGIKRRFEVMKFKSHIFIDDYAHNPAKISATLSTLFGLNLNYPVIIIYQPHGFSPLKKNFGLYLEVFKNLPSNVHLIITDVYYAGGTVEKEVTGEIFARAIKFKNTHYVQLNKIGEKHRFLPLLSHVQKLVNGKRAIILTMGARDITLFSKLRDKI